MFDKFLEFVSKKFKEALRDGATLFLEFNETDNDGEERGVSFEVVLIMDDVIYVGYSEGLDFWEGEISKDTPYVYSSNGNKLGLECFVGAYLEKTVHDWEAYTFE